MKNYWLIILVFCSNAVFAQTKIDSAGLLKLQAGVKALTTDADLTSANWSFCLTDPTTGKIIVAVDEQKSLVPASSQKVVTTIAGINILGSDYRYKTTLEYDGSITKDSVLNGNLYIRGSGDPTLGSARLDSTLRFDSLMVIWADIIKRKGINKITGMIISDASVFEDYATPGSWNWDDIGQYYGAGAYGLNVFENTYTVYYSSNTKTCRIDSIYPEIDGMTVHNDVKVGGSGDEAYIYGAPDNYFRYVTGTIPANRKAYPVDGSMPDPPLFLALELKKALLNNGVQVNKQATTVYAMMREKMTVTTERKTLYTHYSKPLKEIVYFTNQKSNNLYAEAILKTIGKQQLKDGSREAGTDAVTAFYAAKGINLKGMNIEDGSGLSRMNVFTTAQMCALLNMEMKQATFADFKTSLPIAGKTGTLKTVADNTVAAGKVFAKSGSMYKVRSYSGYVQTKSGELVSFCVIVNNYTCGSAEIKAKLEKLMVLMAGL
jgi:serine-type D-Ala-D-Ala carboxypeptidase/endopeptidase (penicillin-binding protein 4)